MKLLNKFFIPLMAAGVLASCSSEADSPNVGGENIEGLYMSLTITPQNMTRTSSPSNIEEDGQATETKVSNVLLVLVDKNDVVVDYSRVSTGENLVEESGNYTATGQFNRNNMITYLQNNPTAEQTKFYVVCNPTSAQEFTVGQKINDFVCDKTPDTYYGDNHFVMSNAKSATVTLPALADVQAGEYSTAETAFEIADVEVERVVARFDYASYIDGSQAKTNDNGNTYYYELANAIEGEADGALNVSIKGLSLANMGKAFYLFKRVNNTGLKTDPFTMFGAETATNYVVGPFGAEKAALNATGDDFDAYFYDAIFGESFNPEFTSVSDIVKDGNKRGDANGNLNASTDNYYFWRYSLTNNLPADPKVTQKNGNSTCVIFRAEITAPNEGALKTAMAAGNDIYVHAGKVIGDYTALKALVEKDAAHAISIAYNSSTLTEEELKATAATDAINKKLVQYGKFAIYKAENGHYYCDYYYWNRHNDNNKPNEMGAMEFAVVRNNIYKLAVTEIAKLGHPTVKEDDPDPLKPDTPDETSDFYMKVKVTLKKWGVRVNNIKF